MKNNKTKAYCFNCKQEQEIIVKTIKKMKSETKYIGDCEKCGAYLCLVIRQA